MPLKDFSEILKALPLMQFDITSFPKTQNEATRPDMSRIEGIGWRAAIPI